MSANSPVILWLRNDLRLSDHPAMASATKGGRPVLPVYILDEAAAGARMQGAASRWWLYGSLDALARALEARGGELILRRGSASEIVPAIAAECGAEEVCFTRAYEPWAIEQERAVANACQRMGVQARRFGGALMFEPEEIATKSGDPFKVFTPFWRACRALGAPRPEASPAPNHWVGPRSWPHSDALETWSLLPTRPDWAGGMRETWTPGEEGARERLSTFLDGPLRGYSTDRDRMDLAGTSGLSPHLHFGEISARQCWRAVAARCDADPSLEKDSDAFVRELGWREFSNHLLFHFPTIPENNFNSAFDAFPWGENDAAREAWRRGRTGYPIVDAAMRQLWQTGWMHNRARMIVASFLVKHLLIDWREGEAWFWDTLVDADLANNAASWQWVAGSGADAAPYFRVFNPIIQGKKFDPTGDYVRRYVPELAGLPTTHIHAPWEAPADVLREASVTLSATYPEPIVEHAAARARALVSFERMKKQQV